jgi:hypothetical protein
VQKWNCEKNTTDATALLAKLTGTINEHYDLIVWLQEYMDSCDSSAFRYAWLLEKKKNIIKD